MKLTAPPTGCTSRTARGASEAMEISAFRVGAWMNIRKPLGVRRCADCAPISRKSSAVGIAGQWLARYQAVVGIAITARSVSIHGM